MGSIIGPDTIREGLVLYLDAGNNKSYSSGTNWFDLSNFKNNGIITDATFDSSIKGGTFIFDGINDKIDCGNDTSVQLTTSFSISVFLKISNTGDNIHVVGRDDISVSSERSFSYGCKDSGEHRLLVSKNSSNVIYFTTTDITDDVWRHIAVTYDTSDITFYENGKFKQTQTSAGSIDDTTSNLTIGASLNSHFEVDGNISIVSVYNRVLSSSEISTIFNNMRHRFNIII